MFAEGPIAYKKKKENSQRRDVQTTTCIIKSILKTVVLTFNPPPARYVAGVVVGQDFTQVREAGRFDSVREGDRIWQLDEGNVITDTARY